MAISPLFQRRQTTVFLDHFLRRFQTAISGHYLLWTWRQASLRSAPWSLSRASILSTLATCYHPPPPFHVLQASTGVLCSAPLAPSSATPARTAPECPGPLILAGAAGGGRGRVARRPWERFGGGLRTPHRPPPFKAASPRTPPRPAGPAPSRPATPTPGSSPRPRLRPRGSGTPGHSPALAAPRPPAFPRTSGADFYLYFRTRGGSSGEKHSPDRYLLPRPARLPPSSKAAK